MIKRNQFLNIYSLLIFCLVLFLLENPANAQVSGTQDQEIKWLTVGSLHQWFSSGGAEIEYGRRGRAGFEAVDQQDGLSWPAQFENQDVNVGKSLWIGTTNFTDPVSGVTYPHKVVCAGRLFMYLGTEIIGGELKLIGKTHHPNVYVDVARASGIDNTDRDVEINPDLPCDRMIYNTFHTAIGVSCTRKVYAYTQQYHDNYFIYEYVFKNTGIIDLSGEQKLNETLYDVMFHWQHRYAFAGESYLEGWALNGAPWGLNCINDAVGFDDAHPGDFKAIWAYYGPHSLSPGYDADVGAPDHTNGTILAGTNYAGVVILHADVSAQDKSNAPNQPMTSYHQPSDRGAQGVDQFNSDLMTQKYTDYMTAGHPDQTHAELLGDGFADAWSDDNGGYGASLGFGPYDLKIGDSIRIVFAEGVAGIMKDREHVREIAYRWFNQQPPYVLPDGNTTTDRNEYKNSWVWSGKDSLFQTFQRAINTYNNNYEISDQPPPPPEEFDIMSGGNKISLTWADNAVTWPNFDGYRLYRAVGRSDTTFDMIFECSGGADLVHNYEDKNAQRGFNYFYYIQTKDNGSTNSIEPGTPLVSSKFYTMTRTEAFLTRLPGKNLSGIRVVPNPYNIKARQLQFGFDTPDRIAFYGLPPKCKIRIFTEDGTLIETIDHTNGSGDEYWNSVTSSRQLVVSGLYIAHFEVTEDFRDDNTNELFLKKGKSTFRKFIVIR